MPSVTSAGHGTPARRKAVITNALDTAKANLGMINGEIRRLAEAAAAGDFSQRGNSARFEHDFRAMVDGEPIDADH